MMWTADTVRSADLFLNVKVTVERLRALDSLEEPGDADFYAVVTINGTEFDNKDTPEQDALEDDDDISPNWQFSQSVNLNEGTIPVAIEIRDEDGFLRFDDDHVDVTSNGGRTLNLTLTLSPCSFGGDVSGACDATVITSGTSDDDNAELRFRIEVVEPPSAPGLRVQCIHSPIWPQPGDTVTITVNALDGALSPKIADEVQVWVDNKNAPASSVAGATTLSFTAGPFSGATFAYGCRVKDDDVPVFTGWRVVSVGDPADSRAIPVVFTGPRSSRIDVVLIADKDSYSSASAAAFLSDAGSVILNAYYSYDLYLTNQDKFNFWLADGTGDAQSFPSGCGHVPPSGWDDDYGAADVGAILHTDNFRDCAPGGERLFSSEPTSIMTVRHETGHRPFGLADEYCCDGGYFQADPFPNVYEEPEDCAEDAPNLGRISSDCREFEETIENWDDFDWSVSDPASNDLMVDNAAPQAADSRRINWMFGNCNSAGC